MKYEVITDIRGYVCMLRHTGTAKDYVELNLEDYDISNGRLYAYKLGKDKLIFNEKEWQSITSQRQRKKNNEEINNLQKLLKESDYIISRWGEEIVALDNPLTWIADVIKINIKYSKQYKEMLKNRKTWRTRIEELRNGL